MYISKNLSLTPCSQLFLRLSMNVAVYNPETAVVRKFDEKAILGRTNIIQVARELGLKVNKSTIPCIKRHRHRNPDGYPTMSINPASNTFRCWVCEDVKGDVIDLVVQLKNVDREQALEYLSIRAGLAPSDSGGFNGNGNGFHEPQAELDKETVYQQFFDGRETATGIDLMAFASLKGGTGKSLIVNNLATIYSLLMHFVAQHDRNQLQNVELIDLDFGKPDQRILS